MAYIESVRERPPLRLEIGVTTPGGLFQRWGYDDPSPANAPSGLSFSSVMPGGFERLSCTLERDPRISYPDLVMGSTFVVRGAGGAVAWEGRLEKLPDTGGFEAQVNPEAVGWQAHLEDDQSAREIYVDVELSRWQGASVQRRINYLLGSDDEEDGSLGVGPAEGGSSLPAVVTRLTGKWARTRGSEAWYDAKGIPLGLLKYAWKLQAKNSIGDATVAVFAGSWEALLATDDVASAWDTSGNLSGEGPSGTGTVAATTTRRWALVKLAHGGAGGTEGVEYPVYWPVLAAYGTHGLTLYGTLSTSEAPGVLASDVVAHAVSKWAPKLAFTTGSEGTIQTSSFVIPQLAFLDATTVAEIIKGATRFELLDWAVWEAKTFYMNERGARGKEWRARVGPTELQQAGPQASRLWNGVVVAYTDPSGVQRLAGPIGSGCQTEDQSLENADPSNPFNELGINHWETIRMGTTTAAGAVKVGAAFLTESSKLEGAGQATVTGHLEDSNGVLWPYWMVRAGDTISFVDAADKSPRRIIHTQCDDARKTNALQLDQPPDQMESILERLSVALAPIGGLS